VNLLLALAQGPADEFWFSTVSLALLSLATFGGGLHYLRRKRLYENTPTSRIRSAAQGYVELEGVARSMPGDPVIAPLTGGRCCWFRSYVEYRDSTRSNKWTVVRRELSGALFHLADDTGNCVVNPDGARVIPSTREVWYGPLAKPPWGPAMGRGLLRAATCKYRYVEERIDIGVPLYSVGYFRTHRGAETSGALHAQVRDLLVEWKKDQRMMAQFDTNADGMIDAAEWEAVREMARRRVHENIAREMPGDDIPVLCKPPDARPYILSTLPQTELIGRKRRRALVCLALSVPLGALAATLLALRGLL
jgi:hypothetical protein